MIARSSAALLLLALAPSARAQMAPIPSEWHPSGVDSGVLDNPSAHEQVVFFHLESRPQAPWLRMLFHAGTSLPAGSYLRMTALWDGGIQRHDADTLEEWVRSSCFFNGDQVAIELVAGPHTIGNRLVIDQVEVGLGTFAPETICGPTDDRVQSTDPRQGRLSVGCTGWLIGVATNTGLSAGLTAGHCTASSTSLVLELNVPNSTSGGSLVRSAPNDQYPWNVYNNNHLNGGVGADWSVAMVGRNSNTHLLPTQANGGAFYGLGAVPASGQIRITGYGTSSIGNLNQVQKTHVGPHAGLTATAIRYATDTTGGNSGSPIVNEANGSAVGIHTHGGCNSGGGYNTGTRVDRSDIQAVLQQIFAVPGSVSAFGAGCPGSTQVAWAGQPKVGQSLRLYFQNLGVVLQPATVVVGISNSNWGAVALPWDLSGLGATNCELLVSFDFGFASTTGLGATQFDMNFPSDGTLVGATLFAQLLFVSPGLNPASLGVSPGAEVLIGA